MIIYGDWSILDSNFEGFISINNEYSWRLAYQDIEIDAFGQKDQEDLVEILWMNENINYLIKDFLTTITSKKTDIYSRISEIYFSIGAPEFGNVENLMALHIPSWRTMVRFLYTQMHNDEDKWYRDRIAPLNRSFFLRSLTEQKLVENLFNKFVDESELIQHAVGSITYIAKRKDSFKAFYNKFKNEVFKNASTQLPNADRLKKSILNGIEKTTKLDEIFKQ